MSYKASDASFKDKEAVLEDDDTPVKFGKLFERASSITKPKTEKSKGNYSDCFLDKFKSRLKPKQTVLPSGLSKVVSLHKEKYGGPDIEDQDDGDDASFGGKKNKNKSDELDEFDNDFEKEFQKVIEERSTYTEWKRNENNNVNSTKKDFKTSSDAKSSLDTVESNLNDENESINSKSSADTVYNFESENGDRQAPVKFARGQRSRVSRVKSDTGKQKTRVPDSEEVDIVSDRDNRDGNDINGEEKSDDDYKDDDDDCGKRKRKRKTVEDTDKKPIKRRKTTAGCVAEVCWFDQFSIKRLTSR